MWRGTHLVACRCWVVVAYAMLLYSFLVVEQSGRRSCYLGSYLRTEPMFLPIAVCHTSLGRSGVLQGTLVDYEEKNTWDGREATTDSINQPAFRCGGRSFCYDIWEYVGNVRQHCDDRRLLDSMSLPIVSCHENWTESGRPQESFHKIWIPESTLLLWGFFKPLSLCERNLIINDCKSGWFTKFWILFCMHQTDHCGEAANQYCANWSFCLGAGILCGSVRP